MSVDDRQGYVDSGGRWDRRGGHQWTWEECKKVVRKEKPDVELAKEIGVDVNVIRFKRNNLRTNAKTREWSLAQREEVLAELRARDPFTREEKIKLIINEGRVYIDKDIAQMLGLSLTTVRTYRKRLKEGGSLTDNSKQTKKKKPREFDLEDSEEL